MPIDAPQAAKPTRSIFDPFNSSATGHQRADNRLTGSTAWRDSRSRKLRQQFASGAGGGERLSDTVGAGSLEFGLDGRTANGGWEKGAKGLRGRGQTRLWECVNNDVDNDNGDENPIPAKRVRTDADVAKPTPVVNPFTPFRKRDGSIRESSWTSHESSPSTFRDPFNSGFDTSESDSLLLHEKLEDGVDVAALEKRQPPPIFANLTFYINGSMAPYSDHRVKRLLSSHGGKISIGLGRRTITHVVIGNPNGKGGSGGGLSGSKIQKEIARVGGKGVKFISAEWVVESIKAGTRLPESRFEALRLAPKGVASVAAMFKPKRNTDDGG